MSEMASAVLNGLTNNRHSLFMEKLRVFEEKSGEGVGKGLEADDERTQSDRSESGVAGKSEALPECTVSSKDEGKGEREEGGMGRESGEETPTEHSLTRAEANSRSSSDGGDISVLGEAVVEGSASREVSVTHSVSREVSVEGSASRGVSVTPSVSMEISVEGLVSRGDSSVSREVSVEGSVSRVGSSVSRDVSVEGSVSREVSVEGSMSRGVSVGSSASWEASVEGSLSRAAAPKDEALSMGASGEKSPPVRVSPVKTWSLLAMGYTDCQKITQEWCQKGIIQSEVCIHQSDCSRLYSECSNIAVIPKMVALKLASSVCLMSQECLVEALQWPEINEPANPKIVKEFHASHVSVFYMSVVLHTSNSIIGHLTLQKESGVQDTVTASCKSNYH